MKALGSVSVIEEGKYNLSLNIDIPAGFDTACFELGLFNSQKRIALAAKMDFADLDLMELSEFYVIYAKAKDENGDEISVERIIKIPTSPIPEEREKNVVKSIINSKDSFFEYISYVLSDDYILTAFENKNKQLLGLEHNEQEELPAIYEKLLKTCLLDKTRIKDLQFVMDNINDKKIIPDEFRNIYDVFIKAMGDRYEKNG